MAARCTCPQRIACDCTMPLGVPVVPEEYMMLKAQSGSGLTGFGRAPIGASQDWSDAPAGDSSRAMRFAAILAAAVSSVAATVASRKNSLAPASAAMPASSSAVHEGASGATTAPARSAPRYTAAYSIDVPAQLAID